MQHTDEEGYEALSCTHTSLRRAQRRLTQFYDSALAPAGLTSSQALIVSLIDDMDGQPGGRGPTLRRLADRLGLPTSALTHGLRPLIRDGLVVILPDDADRRVKHAVLTVEGERRTHRMYHLWRDIGARMESLLGDGVDKQLRELANKVAVVDFEAVLSEMRKQPNTTSGIATP